MATNIWHDLPIATKMFTNVAETIQGNTMPAIENAFVTETGGHSRFPGLSPFAALTGSAPVYLKTYRDDLMAATGDGRLWRIGRDGTAEDVTNVFISGGFRTTFAETEQELVAAAGGTIVRFAGDKTEILSKNAPNTTHVGFIDRYLVATEPQSGRAFYSEPGDYDNWQDLNVITAEGSPDNLTGLIVTPFRELLLIGPRSIEQWETLASSTTPLYRRWTVGEGIFAPYTMAYADNAMWGVTQELEFARITGQVMQPHSGDVGQSLELIDDWSEAWSHRLHIKGQKFLILQAPNATNEYNTFGITLLFDYRQRKWSKLFGWDDVQSVPTRWPGWSIQRSWGKIYVGGNGVVYELTDTVHESPLSLQRMSGRTAHVGGAQPIRVDNVRMVLKRGTGDNVTEPQIRLRAFRDNSVRSRWVHRPIGKAGDRELTIEFGSFGMGENFQFEWEITDNTEVEIKKLQWQPTVIR